jgi:hypothetical protein
MGRGRVFLLAVAGIVAAAAIVVVLTRGDTPAAPLPSANPNPVASATPSPSMDELEGDRHIALTGRDAGECRAASPCATFAYTAARARPGETVTVHGGDYPEQEIRPTRGSRDRPVVFRAAPGAPVRLEFLTVYSRDVEIRDMVTDGWYVMPGARDVTIRDIETRGPMFITSARNVRVLGGSVGPGDSRDSQIKAENTAGGLVPEDILIDGVDFHDWTRHEDPAAHVECLQIGGARRLTIRNSTFRNCATQGLFIRSWGGTSVIEDVTIENNWFGSTAEGYYALRVAPSTGSVYGRISVRYNTSLQSLLIDEGAAHEVSWVGNVAPKRRDSCAQGQDYRHNVWDGDACSASDIDAPLSLVDPASMDLHLAPESIAIDAGDPADHPARDVDGEPRPQGAAPDAGADET